MYRKTVMIESTARIKTIMIESTADTEINSND